MPTGYTDMLDRDETINTREWITKGLSRAFGVCSPIRDHSKDYNEEEIVVALEADLQGNLKYHKEKLEEAQDGLEKYTSFTEAKWQTELDVMNQGIIKRNQKSILEASKRKAKHSKVRTDLEKVITNKDIGELLRGIATYGINQLDQVKSECEPYIVTMHLNLEAYKSRRLRTVNQDIIYHTKHMKDVIEKGKERVKAYLDLQKDLEKVF